METEIVIDTFLADLGFAPGETRERAMRALVEAGLTNGHKSRMAAWKLDSAREALDQALLCVCTDEACLFLAHWRAGDRQLVTVEAANCAVCAGDPARRVISPLRPPVGDELLATVSHLLADKPEGQRIRSIERDMGKLGLSVTQRTLRELAAEHPRFFERRGDTLLRLADLNSLGGPNLDELGDDSAIPLDEPAPVDDLAPIGPEISTEGTSEASEAATHEPAPNAEPDTTPDQDTAGGEAETEPPSPPIVPEPFAPVLTPVPPTPAATATVSASAPASAAWLDADEEKRRFGGFMLALIHIEGELRRRSGDDEGRSGGVLLDFATDRDALVASRANEIRRMLRIRNVLVHEDIDGRPLVSPRPELISRAHEIGRWLAQRGRALDHTEEPLVFEADEPMDAAARRLAARGLATAIVREDGAVYGLLTERVVLAWTLEVLAGERERDETVSEVVDLGPDPRIQFLAGTAEIGEVVGLLRLAAEEKRPLVCLIGGEGTPTDRIRGIATIADLPRLEALLAAG